MAAINVEVLAVDGDEHRVGRDRVEEIGDCRPPCRSRWAGRGGERAQLGEGRVDRVGHGFLHRHRRGDRRRDLRRRMSALSSGGLGRCRRRTRGTQRVCRRNGGRGSDRRHACSRLGRLAERSEGALVAFAFVLVGVDVEEARTSSAVTPSSQTPGDSSRTRNSRSACPGMVNRAPRAVETVARLEVCALDDAHSVGVAAHDAASRAREGRVSRRTMAQHSRHCECLHRRYLADGWGEKSSSESHWWQIEHRSVSGLTVVALTMPPRELPALSTPLGRCEGWRHRNPAHATVSKVLAGDGDEHRIVASGLKDGVCEVEGCVVREGVLVRVVELAGGGEGGVEVAHVCSSRASSAANASRMMRSAPSM